MITDIIQCMNKFMKKVLVKILKHNICKSYIMIVQVQTSDFKIDRICEITTEDISWFNEPDPDNTMLDICILA